MLRPLTKPESNSWGFMCGDVVCLGNPAIVSFLVGYKIVIYILRIVELTLMFNFGKKIRIFMFIYNIPTVIFLNFFPTPSFV